MSQIAKIVVNGSPPWAAEVRSSLPDDFVLVEYAQRKNYVARLADDLAAMVIVDASVADWQGWVTAPNVNNATRRIPVIVVSDDPPTRADAMSSGATVALSQDDLLDQLHELIENHARVIDTERREALDCACRDPLPDLAVQGVEKFNNREFYPQHDLFEEQWMATEGPVRDLYRAVLQVGVAYYQIERGNHRGALKMLLRATQWLEVLPDVCQTIDIAQLRRDAYAVRAALEAIEPGQIEQFDTNLLKPVVRVTP